MFSLQTQRVLRRASISPFRISTAGLRHNSSSPRPTLDEKGRSSKEKIIFSGIQPTGVPHLGNYLGALRQWKKLQDEATPNSKLLFSIVDLHAITIKQDPKLLRQWRKEMYASLLAVGLDPKRSCIFAQGDVPAHTELMWILSCNASMGYLGRMTQWKVCLQSHLPQEDNLTNNDQSKLALPDNTSPLDPFPSNKAALKLGLFSYPVLQAADILLYGTTHVPVGEDQAQHLEFAREIAIGFNHEFAPHSTQPLLVPPETILSPAKRVMSLKEPTKKMSKSDTKVDSRILITDSKEALRKKINSALTDSIDGISYDRQVRPGVSNLLDILYYLDEDQTESPAHLAQDMFGAGMSMKALKEKVADTVEEHIRPVREKYEEVMAMPDGSLRGMQIAGAETARALAEPTMTKVKEAMGLS